MGLGGLGGLDGLGALLLSPYYNILRSIPQTFQVLKTWKMYARENVQ